LDDYSIHYSHRLSQGGRYITRYPPSDAPFKLRNIICVRFGHYTFISSGLKFSLQGNESHSQIFHENPRAPCACGIEEEDDAADVVCYSAINNTLTFMQLEEFDTGYLSFMRRRFLVYGILQEMKAVWRGHSFALEIIFSIRDVDALEWEIEVCRGVSCSPSPHRG